MSTHEERHISANGSVSDIEKKIFEEQIRRQKMLLELGQIITSEMNLEALFDLIIRQTNAFMNTELCSVFMFDETSGELWSLVSTDLKRDEIRIPADRGITGQVFNSKTPLIINDAYSDPRFSSEVDRKTGFRTKNILCIPLINRENKCIGTLQTLNRREGDFTEQDRELLTAASHYVAIALENARLYEDLKLLDRAKEKVINHLSHELKTPLAIISAVFHAIHRKSRDAGIPGLEKTLDRGQRNLKKLMDLQEKIDDILEGRSVEEKERILDIVESAASLLWEVGEDQDGVFTELAGLVSDRLDALFDMSEPSVEEISVNGLLHEVCDEALNAMGERELNLVREFKQDFTIAADRAVLKKVFSGLLKNAVENTPDEGEIVIGVESAGGDVLISFHDFGVGITPQNQPMIFGGFIHTQHTDFYSTKSPYAFGAGGSGSDLLRIRCLADRHNFTIDFKSTRCQYIPEDKDLCPGRISQCPYVSGVPGCLSSGESIFLITFPVGR